METPYFLSYLENPLLLTAKSLSKGLIAEDFSLAGRHCNRAWRESLLLVKTFLAMWIYVH